VNLNYNQDLLKMKFKKIILKILPLCALVSTFSVEAFDLSALSGGKISQSDNKMANNILTLGKATYDALDSEVGPADNFFLGREAAARLIGQYDVFPQTSEITQYVNHVGRNLALASNAPYLYSPYTFIVLKTSQINAFAAPGGLIMITTGMLAFVKNEDELAAILGHEIGHVELDHGVGAVGQEKVIKLTSLAANITTAGLTGKQSNATKMLVDKLLEEVMAVMTKSIRNGYSIETEQEADQRGIFLTHTAGYNASSLVDVIERFKQIKGTYGGAGYPEQRGKLAKNYLSTLGSLSSSNVIARNTRFEAITKK